MEMNRMHTPGPWLNGHWHGNGAIGIRAVGFTCTNNPLATVEAPRVLVDGFPAVTEACVETAEANARLIAAAPRLLAVLKSAMGWHGELTPCDEPDDGLRELLLDMQAAIAAAE